MPSLKKLLLILTSLPDTSAVQGFSFSGQGSFCCMFFCRIFFLLTMETCPLREVPKLQLLLVYFLCKSNIKDESTNTVKHAHNAQARSHRKSIVRSRWLLRATATSVFFNAYNKEGRCMVKVKKIKYSRLEFPTYLM